MSDIEYSTNRGNEDQNKLWKELIDLMDNPDRLIQSTLGSIQNLPAPLEREDLLQEGRIGLFEAFHDMKIGDPKYKKYLHNVITFNQMPEDQLTPDREKSIFMGYAKRQIRYHILRAIRDIIHRGEEREGRTKTLPFSAFRDADDNPVSEERWSVMMDLRDEVDKDNQTLKNFESLFNIPTDSHYSAEELRNLLYETALQVITERKLKGNKSERALDIATKNIEYQAFEALFIRQQPLQQYAKEHGLNYDTFKRAGARIVELLYLYQHEITQAVKNKINQRRNATTLLRVDEERKAA